MRSVLSVFLALAALTLTACGQDKAAEASQTEAIVRPGGWVEVGYLTFVGQSLQTSVPLRAVQASTLALEAPSRCAPRLLAFSARSLSSDPFHPSRLVDMRLAQSFTQGFNVYATYTFGEGAGTRLVDGAFLSLVSVSQFSFGTCPITILAKR